MSKQKKLLVVVPMNQFWRDVLSEVNKITGKNNTNFNHIQHIYTGAQTSTTILKFLPECIEKVNRNYRSEGKRTVYPIEPINHVFITAHRGHGFAVGN